MTLTTMQDTFPKTSNHPLTEEADSALENASDCDSDWVNLFMIQ